MVQRGPDKSVSNERILFEIMIGDGPAVFASELETELPLSRQQITSRLDQLESQNLVTSKKASGRRLWWLTEKGKGRLSETARDELN
jgi:DNA-binding HxlR family transcriptional regulator